MCHKHINSDCVVTLTAWRGRHKFRTAVLSKRTAALSPNCTLSIKRKSSYSVEDWTPPPIDYDHIRLLILMHHIYVELYCCSRSWRSYFYNLGVGPLQSVSRNIWGIMWWLSLTREGRRKKAKPKFAPQIWFIIWCLRYIILDTLTSFGLTHLSEDTWEERNSLFGGTAYNSDIWKGDEAQPLILSLISQSYVSYAKF